MSEQDLAAWAQDTVNFPEEGGLVSDALEQVVREGNVNGFGLEREGQIEVVEPKCDSGAGHIEPCIAELF